MQSPAAKVLSKLNNKSATPSNPIAVLHDLLMAEYGWIPFREFKSFPIQTAYNLLDAAERRHKLEAKEISKKGRK